MKVNLVDSRQVTGFMAVNYFFSYLPGFNHIGQENYDKHGCCKIA
jgi:hypothetical protein